ncbi:MAG: RNA polymerase sigma factor [Bacteroidota bacterium]
MPEAEVQDLIIRCQEGDRAAFRDLVVNHQSFAFGLALRMLCEEHDAADVVQEAFVRVWKHIDDFNPENRFTTWLYAIVSNLCLDRLRGRRRARRLFARSEEASDFEALPDLQLIDEVHSNRELVRIIRLLAEKLSAKQRLVFALRDLQDCSIEETSAITGMSASSVKSNLCYARRHIREMLARSYDVKEL